MARITAYDVMNILFAATIAFFWPCYSIYVLCNECDGLLSDAGRLVQMLWYPGTVDLNYGARGPGRFNGGKESSEVLRGACVPCPQALLTAVSQGYKTIGPLEAQNAYTQQLDVSRALCVRVGDVGLKEGNNYIFRGPRAMSAKEYVLYQLFGPEYQGVFQALYGPKVYEGTGSREMKTLYDVRFAMKNLDWNRKLFASECPWPFLRGDYLSVPKKGSAPYLTSGYYLVNGRPFIPPKLWDYMITPALFQDDQIIPSQKLLTSNGDLWTTVPENYKAQYHMSKAMQEQVAQVGVDKPWYYIAFGVKPHLEDLTELEWWYPNLCPQKSESCGETWYLKTSLQYWTEEHYADYAQRFFAGGGDVQALWSGGMQTQLPNVTVNANALSRAMNK